jgi:enterochelin esterase-like enzyme
MNYDQQGVLSRCEKVENGLSFTVWLPEVCPPAVPTIYLLDGCKVFGLGEAAETEETMNAPRAQDTVAELCSKGFLPPTAVVAIDFPEGETADGFPLRSAMVSLERDGREFSQWLVNTLVPAMEKKFPLLSGAENRTLIGTGLAALNAFDLSLCGGPPEFGRYGCLSTSFEDLSMQIPARCAMLLALEDGAAPHEGARLCFDYGTEGLDECYEPYHRELSALLRNRAKSSGVEVSVLRVAGGTHDAGSWRCRLSSVLRNLFSGNKN